MGLKVFAFPRTQRNQRPVEAATLKLVDSRQADQHPADSLLQEAARQLADKLPFPSDPAGLIGAQDYHIALIPLQNLINELDLDAPSPVRSNPVFILPLTWKDLIGHLRAEVIHPRSNQTNDVFDFGAIRVKLSSMEVHRSGRPVILTRLQFKLLQYFILNPTKVISRDELLNEVWGLNNYPCTRTVDTHVLKLRQKLEADPASPVHFHTVHAAGYKFVP
jgi:DNA-binding winged helix-turn-helix (wHTH) protein